MLGSDVPAFIKVEAVAEYLHKISVYNVVRAALPRACTAHSLFKLCAFLSWYLARAQLYGAVLPTVERSKAGAAVASELE